MLKLIFYMGLTGIGSVMALVSPLAGAITCLLAYLFNPVALNMDRVIQYQFITAIAFIVGSVVHWPGALPRAGGEAMSLVMLWVFAGIAAMSSLWAQYSSTLAINTIYEVIKTLIVVTFLVRAIRSERDFRILVNALIIGVLHAGFMHVLGARLGYVPASLSREYGVLPDVQRANMVLFVPLLVVVASVGSKFERILALITLVFAVDSIVNTYERTGLVSLAIEIGVIVLFGFRKILWRMLPVGILGAALFFGMMTPENYWEWMSTIKTPTEEGSASARIAVAESSIKMFLDYPLQGVGYRNYGAVSPRYLDARWLTKEGFRSAHNSFFSVLCEVGIFGFAAWISAFLMALGALKRLWKAPPVSPDSMLNLYAFAFGVGLIGWMTGGMFMADHEVDPAYWFVGFAIILTRIYAQQRASQAGVAGRTNVAVSGLAPQGFSPLPSPGRMA